MLEQAGDGGFQQGDLPGEHRADLAQRGHLPRERLAQLQAVQPGAAPGAEDAGAGDRDAEPGQDGMDLVLAAGADADQLLPVPGQLPQLAHLPRGDPRLGQPAHPQQISKISSVSLVVPGPPVGEPLHAQRAGQVHLRAGPGQRVRRPVPPVCCLQHHPRVLTGPGDLPAQLRRAVRDPRGLQLPAIRRHPHQHATAPVQVHPDDLPAVAGFRHKGLPTWWRRMHATSSIRQERRPAPSSHQGAHCHPSEWPLTCGYTIPRRVKTASCPCGVRNSGMSLVSATQLLDHVPGRPAESRYTQLSHCHPAIPCFGRAPHRSPDRCALRPHDRRMLVPHLRNPVWAAIFHGPATDSRPRPARWHRSARTPPQVPGFPPRPSAARREPTVLEGAPRYLPSRSSRSPPAKLLTATGRRCTSDAPGIDLAQTRAATGRRPAPRPRRSIQVAE